MELSEIVLKVAECEAAMAALPEDVRSEVSKFNERHRERILEDKRWKEEAERRARAAREEAERKDREEKDKLFCRGEWGEKVPRNRRFALCYKEVPHFIGYCGQEKQKDKWVSKGHFCGVDLVRGYMSPYWMYFGGGADHCWKDRLKPLLEASDEHSLFRRIRTDWNFFSIKDEHDDNFSVCEYTVDERGHVTITHTGEKKSLKEHQEALKKEFENAQ